MISIRCTEGFLLYVGGLDVGGDRLEHPHSMCDEAPALCHVSLASLAEGGFPILGRVDDLGFDQTCPSPTLPFPWLTGWPIDARARDQVTAGRE